MEAACSGTRCRISITSGAVSGVYYMLSHSKQRKKNKKQRNDLDRSLPCFS